MMRVQVIVGFSEKSNGVTHSKGEIVDFDEAYVTTLVELGKVIVLDEPTEASKLKSKTRKASKKNAGKTV